MTRCLGPLPLSRIYSSISWSALSGWWAKRWPEIVISQHVSSFSSCYTALQAKVAVVKVKLLLIWSCSIFWRLDVDVFCWNLPCPRCCTWHVFVSTSCNSAHLHVQLFLSVTVGGCFITRLRFIFFFSFQLFSWTFYRTLNLSHVAALFFFFWTTATSLPSYAVGLMLQ